MFRSPQRLATAAALALAAVACGSSGGGALVGQPSGAPPAFDPPAAPPPAAPPPFTPACDVTTPRTTPLQVWAEPDAGQAPYTDLIGRATRTLRVMVYEMGYGPILDGLEAKARAGLDVRVILDVTQQTTNQKYMDALTAAGAKVIWSDTRFTFMHAKTIVADASEAVVSTGNFAAFRMGMERNFVARDADPADVDVLVKMFDADFARATPDLGCTRLIVSPVNSKTRILALVASAEKEIVVESMELEDGDVRAALAARKAAGVDVRAILADPGWIATNTDAAAFLAQSGIEARSMKAPAVHVKAIVVDGVIAYVGSENLSWTSLTKNREVGVIAYESANAALVHDTFEKDWSTATPFTTTPTTSPPPTTP
jgi:phosphatidylserine/phosphatidylglycerophosphate/cardiolipin synthase-like enzyme